jgi:hypothetical protein
MKYCLNTLLLHLNIHQINMIIQINQHPLMWTLAVSATKQMQSQQSFSTPAKYFMHSRSAGMSFPLAWAAFSQIGKAKWVSNYLCWYHQYKELLGRVNNVHFVIRMKRQQRQLRIREWLWSFQLNIIRLAIS